MRKSPLFPSNETRNNTSGSQFPLSLQNSGGRVINIIVREKDGYIDASLLCQAMGKEWKHYYNTTSTKCFLNELSAVETATTSVNLPVASTTGRNEPRQKHSEPIKTLVELGRNQHVHTWASTYTSKRRGFTWSTHANPRIYI